MLTTAPNLANRRARASNAKRSGRPRDTDGEVTRRRVMDSAQLCFAEQGYRERDKRWDIRLTSNKTQQTVSGFAPLDARMLSFEGRVDARLNMLQSDMKDLNKAMTAVGVDVALLKDKAGL